MILIPILYTEKTEIPNRAELLDCYHQHGGSIVQYDRIVSAIVFTQRSLKVEWVSPARSRHAVGVKHALLCFLLGWWSIPGFFATAGSIINNLMGGIDLTRMLTSPPPLPGQSYDDLTVRELQAAQKRQQYAFLAFLIAVVLLVFIFCVIPYV